MKPISLKGLDEADVRVIFSQLRLQGANLRAILATTTGETIQEPPVSVAEKGGLDIVTSVGVYVAHINELEHRLGGKNPAFNLQMPATEQGAVATTPKISGTVSEGGKSSTIALRRDAISTAVAARNAAILKGDRKATVKFNTMINLLNDVSRLEAASAKYPVDSNARRALIKNLATAQAQLAALN